MAGRSQVSRPKQQDKPFDISKWVVWEAYQRVKANKGAAGVDDQSIAEFERDLKGNLFKLWNRLSSGSYFPPPVKAVEIPKSGGRGVRILGVPTLASNCTSCRSGWGWGLEVGRVGHLLTAGRLDLGWEWHAPAAGSGSGASCAWVAARACSASACATSLASQRASRLRATRRFSGSQATNARSARS